MLCVFFFNITLLPNILFCFGKCRFFFFTKLCYLYSHIVSLLLLFLINISPLVCNMLNIDRYNLHKQKLFGDPQ